MAIGVLLFGAFLRWYITASPLEKNGLQRYELPEESGYILELINEGRHNIHLLDVKVNDATPPGPVYLGVSFDTGQLESMSPEQDSRIEFMNLRDYPIYPRLSSVGIQKALEQKKHTAIHYGIRIVYHEEAPIQKVSIRYRYFGMTKTLTVTKWFET